jgi:xylulokinase
VPPPTAESTATLGIDLGTSSVKAVVVTVDGRVAGQATGGYRVLSPQAGHSESEPAEWLAATANAVRAAVAEAGVEPVAIGLAGQMHGVVPTAADGRPVRAAMLWSDSRATRELARYEALAPAVRARLANPLSPGMAGPLLAWLATHEPAAWAATRWALQPKDWLRAQLTGRFVTEPSDASATLLYDVAGDRWDTEVVAALDLDPAKLPPILARAGDRAGSLTDEGARLLGLRPGLPVAAGAADTAAAALGSGLVKPGTMQLTIGTGAQLIKPMATLPDPLPVRPVTHLYRAATDTGWYAMGAVLNGGLTLDWVRRVLGAGWPELYASARPPRADDPLFLPHLHGERTPYLDPGLRGAWTGLGPRHGRRDLLRAALEGVAFAVREALDELAGSGARIDRLRLAGGGTKDLGWRQMLADILGCALAPVEVPAASALGAARLGAQAAGLPAATPADNAVAPATVVPSAHADLYHERLRVFHRSVHCLRQISSGTTGGELLGAASTPDDAVRESSTL